MHDTTHSYVTQLHHDPITCALTQACITHSQGDYEKVTESISLKAASMGEAVETRRAALQQLVEDWKEVYLCDLSHSCVTPM